MSSIFAVGDHVVPKPEWVGSPNNIPSGIVRAVAPWGKDGCFYVGYERRAFAAYVFDLAPADAVLPPDLPPDPAVAVVPIQADLFEAAE